MSDAALTTEVAAFPPCPQSPPNDPRRAASWFVLLWNALLIRGELHERMLAELASSTGALERATRDLTRMRRDLVARHFTALPGRASRAMFAAFATRIAEQEGCAGDLRELEAAVQVAQDARASYAALDAELTAKDRQWEMYEPAMLRRLKANTRRLRRVPESLDAEIEP